ncbi:unnamed protein product, partial [Mesorhabditis spiculigera]
MMIFRLFLLLSAGVLLLTGGDQGSCHAGDIPCEGKGGQLVCLSGASAQKDTKTCVAADCASGQVPISLNGIDTCVPVDLLGNIEGNHATPVVWRFDNCSIMNINCGKRGLEVCVSNTKLHGYDGQTQSCIWKKKCTDKPDHHPCKAINTSHPDICTPYMTIKSIRDDGLCTLYSKAEQQAWEQEGKKKNVTTEKALPTEDKGHILLIIIIVVCGLVGCLVLIIVVTLIYCMTHRSKKKKNKSTSSKKPDKKAAKKFTKSSKSSKSSHTGSENPKVSKKPKPPPVNPNEAHDNMFQQTKQFPEEDDNGGGDPMMRV